MTPCQRAFGFWFLALLLPAASFAQSPGTAPDTQWHVGKFSGQIADANQRMDITVTCESSTACEYTLRTLAPSPNAGKRNRADVVQSVDVTIPNNNLRFTRNAIKANAGAYAHDVDGALLRELRPLLESSATFDTCVGSPDPAGSWGRLCKLGKEDPALPAAVLLVPTLNPLCQGRRFCAYYFFPLRRSSGAG